MAVAGIIENHTGWKAVVDPDYQVQPLAWHQRLLGKRPPRAAPPSVKAADFIDTDVADHADRFVESVKRILSSDTVISGGLGDPQRLHTALIGYLYKQLVAMRTVDDSVVELHRAQSTATTGTEHVIEEMSGVIADGLERTVLEPTRTVEALASQVSLRDMQHRLPHMAQQMEGEHIDSLDAVSARLQALLDLDTTMTR